MEPNREASSARPRPWLDSGRERGCSGGLAPYPRSGDRVRGPQAGPPTRGRADGAASPFWGWGNRGAEPAARSPWRLSPWARLQPTLEPRTERPHPGHTSGQPRAHTLQDFRPWVPGSGRPLPPPPGGFLPTLTPRRGGGVGTVPGRAPPPAGRPGRTFPLPFPGVAGYPSIQPDPPETDHPLPYSAHSVTTKTTPPPETSRPDVHSCFIFCLFLAITVFV